MEIEVYRTRKGFVLLDTARNLYEVHLRRPGSTEFFVPEEGQCRDRELAIAVLRDYRVGTGG